MANLANPTVFVDLSRRVLPWLAAATAALFAVGLFLSFAAPPDYQQGETVKIMYLHVPAAWMATFVYAVMAAAALGTLVWRHPLADAAQKAAAPLGAGFTFICLVTGSLWGKPMWGTYWVWDARLTSVLVLFIIYLGLIALWRAIDDPGRAARAVAILTLVGCVNLPIIKFSVDWWNTLHQPASVFRLGGPTIAPSLLWPLIVMSLAFTCLFLTLHVMAIRNEILRRRIARATMLAAAEGDRLEPGFAAGGALMADPHIGFVVAAYAVAAATIAAMIGAVVLDGRRLNAQMDEAARALEAARRGATGRARMSADAETAQRPRRWLAYLPLAVFAALAWLLFERLYAGDPASIPSTLIGQSAPRLDLTGLDGATGLTDADLRAGHVSVVNIFASWCEPCHYEHEYLMALAADPSLKDKGVAIYGVAQKD